MKVFGFLAASDSARAAERKEEAWATREASAVARLLGVEVVVVMVVMVVEEITC